MIKNTDRILFLSIYKEDYLKGHPGQINDTEASLLYHGDSSIMELQIRTQWCPLVLHSQREDTISLGINNSISKHFLNFFTLYNIHPGNEKFPKQ